MKKTIKQHEEKNAKSRADDIQEGAVPTFLMDREQQRNSKVLTNMVKQKRKEKAGKWTGEVIAKDMTIAGFGHDPVNGDVLFVTLSGQLKRLAPKK